MSTQHGGQVGRDRRRGARHGARDGAKYLALLAYLVFLAFPLLWLLSISLKSPRELAQVGAHLVPRHWQWGNYADALAESGLLRSALNSTVVALAATALTLVVAVPAAYAVGRTRSRVLRGTATGWILVSQLFPVILVVLPLFVVLRSLHLLSSLVGLTLVYLVWTLPLALWLLRGFVAAVPVELEEAAATDGAGRWRILVSIVLPLLRPGVVVTALFAFITSWNEFFFALVLLQGDAETLPLTLARFVGAEGQLRLGPLAAAAVMATVPSLLVFAVLQHRLTSALLGGAEKG